jgi:hypothetical protein
VHQASVFCSLEELGTTFAGFAEAIDFQALGAAAATAIG